MVQKSGEKTSWGNDSSSHYLQDLNIQPVVGNGISAINSMTICIYHDYINVCPERCWGVANATRSNQSLIPWSPTQGVSHPLKNKGQKPLFSKPMLQRRIMNTLPSPPPIFRSTPPKIWSEQWKKTLSCLGSSKSIRCFFFFRGSSGVSNGLPRRAKDLFQRAQRAWKATKSEDSVLWVVGRGLCCANNWCR